MARQEDGNQAEQEGKPVNAASKSCGWRHNAAQAFVGISGLAAFGLSIFRCVVAGKA
jgi:hypothetical protein